MQLSAAQQATVERTGQDVCCVAGPGSGKTRVLVERFAWLAGTTARPEAILAITFTEKAAQEIKARLVKHFIDRGNDDLRRRVERAQVSTIHGFCNGVLSEFALDAGLDPAFRVMDEYEARLEHARAVESALNRFCRERAAEFQRLVETWAAEDLAEDIRGISEKLRYAGGAATALAVLPAYHPAESFAAILDVLTDGLTNSNAQTAAQITCRNEVREWLADSVSDLVAQLLALPKIKLPRGKTVEALNAALKTARELAERGVEEAVGERNLPALATLRTILIECEQEYSSRKRQLGALDFTDLEEQAVALLEGNDSIRKTVSERFDAILMDELQDTNPIQWRIVNAIRREGRFFAVGDINQSIFGWRGADPDQFLAYQQEFTRRTWQIDRLQANYRSREAILKAVERVCVASQLGGIQSHALQAGRAFSTPAEVCLEVIRAEPTPSEEAAPEAAWVAQRILELKQTILAGDPQHPLRFGDIAILSRGAAVFDDYEAALRGAGIPCLVQRGRNFFEEPEIVDLTNLLRVLVNPENGPALLGLLRSPLVGVTDEEIFERHQAGLPLAPDRVIERLDALRALREEAPLDSLLVRFLDESGHWGRLTPAQRANVRKLLRTLRSRANAQPGSLATLVEELGGLRESGRENNAPVPGAEDAVQMLSVHGAKGLEFPVVFLVSMHKAPGGKSRKPRIELSRERGLGAVWRIEGQDETQQDGAMRAAEDARKAREAAEEDRLLYVAMTRAEERLILVWSDRKRVDRRWIGPVTEGLGLDFSQPFLPGVPAEQNGVRLLRTVGEPPPFESETGQRAAAAECVGIEPAAIPLPEPPSVTATTLAHFAACPRRYFLHSLLGWPEAGEASQTAAAELVSTIDGEPVAGRELDEEPSAAMPGGASFGDEVHRLLAGVDVPEASPEARELALRFTQSETGQRAARASRAGRETPILFDYEGLLIRGAIDLWFEDNGELVLVDYKTDQHIGDERLREYSTQLRLYAIALSSALGRRVDRIVLAVLRGGREIQVGLSPAHEQALRDIVAEFRASHRAGRFPLVTGRQCAWCPYAAGACPQPKFADSEARQESVAGIPDPLIFDKSAS
jgi:ATP-dependent exoDNAse (exonuclease V) beta subunit